MTVFFFFEKGLISSCECEEVIDAQIETFLDGGSALLNVSINQVILEGKSLETRYTIVRFTSYWILA